MCWGAFPTLPPRPSPEASLPGGLTEAGRRASTPGTGRQPAGRAALRRPDGCDGSCFGAS